MNRTQFILIVAIYCYSLGAQTMDTVKINFKANVTAAVFECDSPNVTMQYAAGFGLVFNLHSPETTTRDSFNLRPTISLENNLPQANKLYSIKLVYFYPYGSNHIVAKNNVDLYFIHMILSDNSEKYLQVSGDIVNVYDSLKNVPNGVSIKWVSFAFCRQTRPNDMLMILDSLYFIPKAPPTPKEVTNISASLWRGADSLETGYSYDYFPDTIKWSGTTTDSTWDTLSVNWELKGIGSAAGRT